MIFTVVSLRCDVRFSTQRPDDGRSVLSFTSLEDILRKAIVTPRGGAGRVGYGTHRVRTEGPVWRE